MPMLASRAVDEISAGITIDRWGFSDHVDAVILSNPWTVAVARKHGTEWDRWLLTLAGVMRLGYRRPHADAIAMQHLLPAAEAAADANAGLCDAELAAKYRLPIVVVETRLAALGLATPPKRHLRLVVAG